ncbi:unannotated protein [freshwater metagenome]|uniref:Unannotated protein n=1 Tax=freshwater metagenome TaxID=449393 RepID=A0A6J7PNR8_9ZZZZ
MLNTAETKHAGLLASVAAFWIAAAPQGTLTHPEVTGIRTRLRAAGSVARRNSALSQ